MAEANDFAAIGLNEPTAPPSTPTRPVPNVDPALQVAPITTAPNAPDTSQPLPQWDQITADPRWQSLNPDQKSQLVDQYANNVNARAKEAGENPDDIATKSNAWRQQRQSDIANPKGAAASILALPTAGALSSAAGIVAGVGVNMGDLEDPRAKADRALGAVPLNYLQSELTNVQGMQQNPRKAYQDYIKENPEVVNDPSNRMAHDFDYFQNNLTRRAADLQSAIAGHPVNDIRTMGDAVTKFGSDMQQGFENDVDPNIRNSFAGKLVMTATGMIPYMATEAIPGVGQGITAAMLQAQSRGDIYGAEKAQIAGNPKFANLTPDQQDELARQNSLFVSLPSAILATKGVSMLNAGIPARNIPAQLMKDAFGFGLISGGSQAAKELVDTSTGTDEKGNNPWGNILGATGEGLGQGLLLGAGGALAGTVMRKQAEIQAVKDTHTAVSQMSQELVRQNPDVFRDSNHAYDTIIQPLPDATRKSLIDVRTREQTADAHDQSAKELDSANAPQSAAVERQLADKARNTPPTAPSDLANIFDHGVKDQGESAEPVTPAGKIEEPVPKTLTDFVHARDETGLATAVGQGLPVTGDEFEQHAPFLHGKYAYDTEGQQLVPVENPAKQSKTAAPEAAPTKTFAEFARDNDAKGLQAALDEGQQVPVTHADFGQYQDFADQNGFDAKWGKGQGAGTVIPQAEQVTLREHSPAFTEKMKSWTELPPEKQDRLLEASQFLQSLTSVADDKLSGYQDRTGATGEDIVSAATLKAAEQLQRRDIPPDAVKAFSRTIFNSVLNDAQRQLGKIKEKGAPQKVALESDGAEDANLHNVIADANAIDPRDHADITDTASLVDQFRTTLNPNDRVAFDAALKDKHLESYSKEPINESNTAATDRDRVFESFRDFARRRLTHSEPRPTPSEPTVRTSNSGTSEPDGSPQRTTKEGSGTKGILNDNGRNQPAGERAVERPNGQSTEVTRPHSASADENTVAGLRPDLNGSAARGSESTGSGRESGASGAAERGAGNASASNGLSDATVRKSLRNLEMDDTPENRDWLRQAVAGEDARTAALEKEVAKAATAGQMPDTRSGLMDKLNAGEISPAEYKARWKGLQSPPVVDPRPGWTEAPGNARDPVAERLHTGNAADALSALQEHGNDAVRDALPRLEAQRDRLARTPIHIIDSPDTGGFYHDGKIFLTKGQLGANNLHQVLAHEMAHAVTHSVLSDPHGPGEEELVRRFDRIRQEVLGALPAEMRDAYYQKVQPLIEARRAAGDDRVDYNRLTEDEKKWMPVLYALSNPHETVAQLYSSPAFRSFAKSVRYYGDSWFERLSNWVGAALGFDTKSTALDHFWSTADQINDAAARRPGVPVDSNPLHAPPDVERKPITAEVRLARKLSKYNVAQGTNAILDAIAEKTKNPTYGAVATFLKAALERSPEVKIDVTRMQQGELGMYGMHSDRIRVNQELNDGDTERAILHELTHAVSAGKINAWMLDRMDQLSPSERGAISDLEGLRQKALAHPTTPEEIKALAAADPQTRTQIFQALDSKFNKYYGLINLPEFVSEAVTNGDFQKHLAGMKDVSGPKPKGIMSRVWDAVSRLFGGKEDSVLARTLERIGTVTEGGRRLMGAETEVAGMQGYKNRMMVDDQAEVDRQRNNGAINGAIEGESGTKAELSRQNLPHDWNDVGANKEPSFESQYNPRAFEGLKDGADVLDRVAQAKGLRHEDIESLRSELDKAFNQDAINPHQYAEGWRALDSTSFPLLGTLGGSKEDRNSFVRRMGRWMKDWTSEGNLPRVTEDTGYRSSPAFEAIRSIQTKRDAAAQVVRDRLADLDRAVRQDYKSPLEKVGQAKLDQFTQLLQGRAAPADFPINTYRAIRAMRDSIDYLSRQAQVHLPPDMAAKFADNEGFYTKRSYRIFDDPRWIERNVTEAKKDQVARDLVDKFRSDKARDAGTKASDQWLKWNPGGFGSVEHRAAFGDAYDHAMAEAQKTVSYSSMRDFVDRQMSDFRQIAEGKNKETLFGRSAAKTDTDFFKERQELPASYRELLGENTDPRAVFAASMQKLSDFLATSQGLRDIRSAGEGEWLFNKNPKGIYDEPIAKQDNKAFSPLDGMYTTPEIAHALKAVQFVNSSNSPIINAAMKLNRMAKTAHTIDSVRSAIRNFTTQGFNLVMNGHGLSPDAVKGAVSFLATDWGKRSDAGLRDQLLRYRGLGLLDQDPNVRMLREISKAWNKNSGQPIDLQDAIAGHAANAFKPLRKIQNFAEHFYATADSMGKILNFEMDRSMLQKAFPQMGDAELDTTAAKRTLDTMPTWSRMSPNMRAVVGQPFFGPFAGYFGEATRAATNSAYYAFKDLKEGVRQGNGALTSSGVRRIAGIGAALTGPALLSSMTARAVGMNDKDVENFRKLLPWWEQNAALLFFKHENGKVGYANLNYSSPYSYFTDAMTQVGRSLANHEDVPTAAAKTLGALMQNFTDPGLIFPRIYRALWNQNDFGNPIVNPNLPGTEQFMGRLGYAAEPLWGGTPGRVIYSWIPTATGHTTSSGGMATNLGELVGGELSGGKIAEVDLGQRLSASLNDDMDDFHKVEELFTSPFKNPGHPMSSDEIKQAYAKMEGARYHAFMDVHDKVQAALQSGVAPAMVHQALSRYDPKEQKQIMAGVYVPYRPSKNLLHLGQEAGKQLPPNTISTQTRSLNE